MPSLVVEACSVLGVEPGPDGTPPDEAVVAGAFKKLAIKWHPDRNPDAITEATQRFAEISAARDLLLDPPTNAMLDESTNRGAKRAPPSSHPKSSHSKSLRAFEGDVSQDIDSGVLSGAEAAGLFEGFGLWAVWKCDGCEAVCCRIRKNKYSCMCGHRLRDHDAGRGFRCADPKCPCRRFSFQVQDTDQPHKCRCKHAPKDHAPAPPHACQKCDECDAFDSPWICNCGHRPSEHRTCFVRHKMTERSREWVAGGLRGECIAMADKFRARSIAERVSFIERANAAKAAGFPSWKSMLREAKLHATHGTTPAPDVPHAGSGPPTESAGFPDGVPRSTAGPGASGGAAASRDGFFSASNETTHGLSTDQLRERLAQAGVGLREASAADLGGAGNLW